MISKMERCILNMDGKMLVKKSFYFARHGETDYNRRGVCAGGMIDCPINETGREQALVLRDKLSDIKIHQVISSSMQRARQTTEIAYSFSYSIEPGIREWELGELEEQPASSLFQYTEKLPNHLPIPGGESKDDLQQRVVAAINKALMSCEGNILFVSHGGVYWSLLKAVDVPVTKRVDKNKIESWGETDILHIGNAELVHFQAMDGGWNIVKI